MVNHKKILFIINSGLLNAGVPRVAVDIISKLHKQFKFDILVQSSAKGYYDDYLINLGCKIHYWGETKSGRLTYFYNLTTRILKLLWLVRKEKYDIVQSFTGYQSGIDCFAAKLAGAKIRISNVHGKVKRNNTLITGTYQKVCRYLIKASSTHRLAVSSYAASPIYDGMNYNVVYNSVPFNEYSKIIKKTHEGINLIQIGYFNENKNQLFSLKLLKFLIARKVRCCIYFIGYDNDGEYLARMKKYIEENNLNEYVIFLPHNYDKIKIFSIIDYMIQPSHSEGLSLVPLECQAARISCLVSENVTSECGIGLLHQLPLSDMAQWSNFIANKQGQDDCLNDKSMQKFSSEAFVKNFTLIYSGQF